MTAAPQAILDLVERYARNADFYRSPSYNETQARRVLIDPVFVAPRKQLAMPRRPRPRSCSSGRHCRELRRTIDATDRQIDRLVYEIKTAAGAK